MHVLIFLLFSMLAFPKVLVSESNLEEKLKSSPEVQEYQRRYESAQKLRGHLFRSFLPSVDLIYGQERFTTGPYDGVIQPYGGVEAKLNLYNSGRDRLEGEIRNLKARDSMMEAKITRARILVELRKALTQFAYIEEVEGILKEALSLLEASSKDARKRIDAGLTTETDLLDFKQQTIQINQDLQKLSFEKGVAQRMIATLLGHDPTEELEIHFKNSHPVHGQEDKLSTHSEKSLLVRKADVLKQVAEVESAKAKRWWAPEVEVYGYALRFTQKEREYPTTQERNDYTLGIKLTLPIFDGGDSIAEARAQALLAKAQGRRLRAKKLEVERDTLDAMKRLDLVHGLIHGAEENVEVMEKYRKGIKREYGKGVKNSPDVLQATQRWISAREKFADVKRNYHFAKADALFLMNLAGKEEI